MVGGSRDTNPHVLEDVFDNAVQNVRPQRRKYGTRDRDEWPLRKLTITY